MADLPNPVLSCPSIVIVFMLFYFIGSLVLELRVNKETGDTLVLESVSDSYCKQFGYTQHLYFSTHGLDRDRVTNHEFFEHTVFDVLVGLTTEHRMPSPSQV